MAFFDYVKLFLVKTGWQPCLYSAYAFARRKYCENCTASQNDQPLWSLQIHNVRFFLFSWFL